jgi:hypothetical protein
MADETAKNITQRWRYDFNLWRNESSKTVGIAFSYSRLLFPLLPANKLDAARPLRLVDLTGPGLAQLGADARLWSGSIRIAQLWSQALFNHPEQPDGIYYLSRLNPARCCAAIFDRVGEC